MDTLTDRRDIDLMHHARTIEGLLESALTAYDRISQECAAAHREVRTLRAQLASSQHAVSIAVLTTLAACVVAVSLYVAWRVDTSTDGWNNVVVPEEVPDERMDE
jgi:hypothetical protein